MVEQTKYFFILPRWCHIRSCVTAIDENGGLLRILQEGFKSAISEATGEKDVNLIFFYHGVSIKTVISRVYAVCLQLRK